MRCSSRSSACWPNLGLMVACIMLCLWLEKKHGPICIKDCASVYVLYQCAVLRGTGSQSGFGCSEGLALSFFSMFSCIPLFCRSHHQSCMAGWLVQEKGNGVFAHLHERYK